LLRLNNVCGGKLLHDYLIWNEDRGMRTNRSVIILVRDRLILIDSGGESCFSLIEIYSSTSKFVFFNLRNRAKLFLASH
jgi:hypothetical protein